MKLNSLVAIAIVVSVLISAQALAANEEKKPDVVAIDADVTQGCLRVEQDDGTVIECPLKHTDVVAEISGFIASVKVTQTFYNPFEDTIEAVYVFPLPHGSAVNHMTMVIGERRIVGIIKKRDEALWIYEEAIRQGKTAARLDQERPNIFTQTVGNIQPGQEIRIEISYIDVLEYDMGEYTFHFPMVVGPRYNPPGFKDGIGAVPAGREGESGQKIETSHLRPGQRTGHDIALSVSLNAGVPVRDLAVTNHKATIERFDAHLAKVTLSPADAIPNKDFEIKYKVAGEKPEIAILAHSLGRGSGGYFMLMIQPKIDEQLKQAPPREICFLVDVSGSMRGRPTEQVKQTMREFFKLSKPDDTFQLITFASQAHELFDGYVPATKANIEKALDSVKRMSGGGGTRMLEGIKKVVDAPVDPKRMRIVIMLTDGYIGNEKEIINEVDQKCGDNIRFWTIGIGKSVNRFLIDGVARQGGGMGKVLSLDEDPAKLVPEIVERIHRAQLAKISIDWGKLGVYEIYPMKVPELWAGRPVILFGRYFEPGDATVMINGFVEGEPISYPVQVELPETQPQHGVLGPVWARKKIEDLSYQMLGADVPELVDEITRVALIYRLMSKYTSFVAVDEKDADKITAPATPPRRVSVPVPMPDGVSFEGVFGPREGATRVTSVMWADSPMLPEADEKPIVKRLGIDVPLDKLMIRARNQLGEQEAARALAAPSASARGRRRETVFFNSTERMDRRPMTITGGTVTMDGPADRWGALRPRGGSSDEVFLEAVRQFLESEVAEAAGPEGNKLSFEFDGAPLRQVFTFLSEATGVKIIVDPEAAGDVQSAKVTLKQENVNLPVALGAIVQPHGLRYELKGDSVHIVLTDSNRIRAFINNAKKAEDAGKLVEAYTQYQRACLLAGVSRHRQARRAAGEALRGLLRVRHTLRKQYIEKLPALNNRLDIVIRHKSLNDAIAAVARAGGVEITVIPGSFDDVKRLLELDRLEVTYLDLRNATVAQALVWLLDPFQLNWNMVGEKATIGTSRRLITKTPTPWVYSIGYIAMPTKQELGEDKAAKFRIAAKAPKEILEAVRTVVGTGKARLLGASRLMIFGTSNQHALVAFALSALRSGPMPGMPSRQIAGLAPTTAKRYAAHAEVRTRRIAQKQQRAVIEALAQYSWKLMAGALAGEADLEALSCLEFAWNSPHCADVLKQAGGLPTARSTWAVAEAARLLPKNAEVRRLAAKAAATTGAKARAALAPADDGVVADMKLLEYALAARSLAAAGIKDRILNKDFADAAAERLRKAKSWIETAAEALLQDLSPAERATVADKLKGPGLPPLRGDHAVVIYGLACRRAGGAAWANFRRVRSTIRRRSMLSGSAQLIINRLARQQVAVAQ